VISPKLAGKIRFLDSTEEEQRRGITMHSSAIALLFRLEDKSAAKAEKSESFAEEYLINLVDSPGHIDFSSDVSTATRLCDGALIVIDVLEGLCTQTHAVIYKALRERMKPCLVLNKLDRLAVEMKLTPIEAFHHLRRIIENVNALAFSLLTSELRQLAELEGRDPNIEISEDDPFLLEWNFSPEKGNVIFASAIDSWGFSITKFSNMWAKKLGLNRNVLQKYFFEDYSFNSKTIKIVKYNAADSSMQPMFAEMILKPIWDLYEAAVVNTDLTAAVNLAEQEVCLSYPNLSLS
jgi:ribosome assembly protein 1